MAGGVGRLRIRSSRPPFEERRARGGGESYCEVDGGGRGVWKSSEAGRRWWQRRLEREHGTGEVGTEQIMTKTSN